MEIPSSQAGTQQECYSLVLIILSFSRCREYGWSFGYMKILSFLPGKAYEKGDRSVVLITNGRFPIYIIKAHINFQSEYEFTELSTPIFLQLFFIGIKLKNTFQKVILKCFPSSLYLYANVLLIYSKLRENYGLATS